MTPNESEIEPSTITMTLKEFKAYCDRERAAAHARAIQEIIDWFAPYLGDGCGNEEWIMAELKRRLTQKEEA